MRKYFTILTILLLISTIAIFAQEKNLSKDKLKKNSGTKNINSPASIGDKVIIKDESGNALIEVNDEGDFGSITMPGSTSAPTTTTNKLYNVGGILNFNGTELSTASSAVTEINDLADAKTGGNSVFLGTDAGINDDGTDNRNTAVGVNVLNSNTTGFHNTAKGYGSLKSNTTGKRNSAYGYHSLFHNTEGYSNNAIGNLALFNNLTGFYNTATGNEALAFNTTGNKNVAYGNYALWANTTGLYNVGLGYGANYNNQEGSKNTIIGFNAGKGSSPHTKSGNIFLGYKAGFYETGSNKLYIQNDSSTTPLIGGDFASDEIYLNGNVGIGTTSPTEMLQVAGTLYSTVGGYKFPDGTVQATAATSSSASGWTDVGTIVRLITSTDKVGIGASIPNSLLSVGGNGNIDAAISGTSTGETGRGVYGYATNSSNNTNYGGYFEAAGINGRGVNGVASGTYGKALFGEATGTNGFGVYGSATNVGNVTNYGGYFKAAGDNGYGVYAYASDIGDGTNYGGYFKAAGESGFGVYGYATNLGNGTATNYGGYFKTDGEVGVGVFGEATYYHDETNYGGYFLAAGESGRGVYGSATNDGDVTNYGGYFRAYGDDGYGVYSVAYGSSGCGVHGIANGSDGRGISGLSFNSTNGRAVYGYANGTSSYAGYFHGRLHCSGTLSKGGGSFKIDHPLDPTNKNLYHSFVESPDMMNVYNGNVNLDENGEAVVELAKWFEALNKDFRYQLTCIGGFAPIYIAEEISGNQFKIAGGKAGMKVSWQVTGIRQDAFANANRIPVEEMKNEQERGKYLYPEAFNMSKTLGVDYDEKQENELLRMQEYK